MPYKTKDSRAGRIMIVDDETELMGTLCEMLAMEDYETAGFISGMEALEALKNEDYDILLTDLVMPQMDGIELLRAGLKIDPHLVGIIMTGYGKIQTAVEAIKNGAFDYITKPFTQESLLAVLSRAMELRRLRMENMHLRELVAIQELGKATSSTFDQDLILSKVVDAARSQCDADEVSVMLPTPDGKQLCLAAAWGSHIEKYLGICLPLDHGIAGRVAQTLEPVILYGEVQDPLFAPITPGTDICAAVSLPMLARGNLVGVLNASIKRHRRPFTPGELKSLNILAGIFAPILENARLYTQVHRAEEKFRSIFENAVEGIYQSSPNRRFITANPALAYMLGYDTPGDLIKNITDISRQIYVDLDYSQEFSQLMETQGEVRGLESRVYRKDGGVIWISENARAVHDGNGALLYYEGTIEDITERKQAEENLRQSYNRLQKTLNDTIRSMSKIVESKDPYTAGHQERVTRLASAIAQEMGLQGELITGLQMAAIIHDIGKISVPSEILTKPGKLNNIEFKIIQTHPAVGYEILKMIEFTHPIAEIVHQHHERMNGSGYPKGLSKGETLLEARILAVADVVEAMASHRPYRSAIGIDKALDEIIQNSGILFDPEVVAACCRLFKEKGFSVTIDTT